MAALVCRLAEQAQRQLEKGGKFEDLNQISRPTELIRSYNSLYSQARIDALDALDTVRQMSEAEDLKSKLLFSVIVVRSLDGSLATTRFSSLSLSLLQLAFRHAQTQAKDVRNKIKQILQLTNDKSSAVLEETVEKYLRTTIQKYDVGKITFVRWSARTDVRLTMIPHSRRWRINCGPLCTITRH